ncbi:MAG: sulfite exporter TauE/SafE family protein, partial [Chloroflexota bacterium]|nr:sulfite exporter TauE/SafE family protein [Chloroflexota bacterium]
AGAGWASRFSELQLRRAILILLTAIGFALMIETFVPIAGSGFLPGDQVIRMFVGLLFGAGIGLFSSLLGVAGGEVIIPTLVFAFGVDIKVAGTASLLISLPTVLAGIARYGRRGDYADRQALGGTVLPMSLGSVLGALAGGLAVGLVPAGVLKVGLGVILIWSAQRIFSGGHDPATPDKPRPPLP